MLRTSTSSLALKIPVFRTLEDFYARQEADLAIISSPIQFHCEQTCLALERGSFVLCEKPPAGTIQEVRRMIAARDAARKWVAVGYQWSFSDAIQSLKKDILEGAFGQPGGCGACISGPAMRPIITGTTGRGKNVTPGAAGSSTARPITPWPMTSTTCSMSWEGPGRRARSRSVSKRSSTGPTPIENFDTIALRCATEDGVEIFFYASHAADLDTGPVFSYEFEKGAVSVRGRDTAIRADFWNGEGFVYGFPDAERHEKAPGRHRRREKRPASGLRPRGGPGTDALPQRGAGLDARDYGVPGDMLAVRGEPGQRFISVAGLAESLTECYESSLLPSEMDLPWSRKGELIDIARYGDFPLAR